MDGKLVEKTLTLQVYAFDVVHDALSLIALNPAYHRDGNIAKASLRQIRSRNNMREGPPA
jgi:hypothetical protein